MRNKSTSIGSSEKRAGQSDLSTMSTPIRKSSVVNSERKSSVGDLISLATEQETQVVFDPLLDNQRLPPNPHRKLQRTSNPSSGKYENYVPPGGSSQPQFRQFLSTMTDQQAGQSMNISNPATRSSDDLLSEYGLNFNSANISAPQPAPRHSSFSQPFHPHPNISAPTIPPRSGNTSFLHNSGTSLLNQSTTTSPLPVNSRISVLTNKLDTPPTLPSCRDILADLDPLRSGRDAVSHHGLPVSGHGAGVGGPHHLQPPTVPPRTKKQWTTFD